MCILFGIYNYILSALLLKIATLSKNFSVGKQTFLGKSVGKSVGFGVGWCGEKKNTPYPKEKAL